MSTDTPRSKPGEAGKEAIPPMEKPATDMIVTRAKDATERHAAEDRDKLMESITEQRVQTANDVVSIPFEKVTQDEYKPDVTFDQLQDAVEKKEWAKVVTVAFKLLFGKGNSVTGLGFDTQKIYEDGIKQLDPVQQAGILKQIERMERRKVGDWRKKMQIGIVHSSTGLALYRRGFTRMGPSQPAGAPIAVKEGDTLQKLLKPEVWDALQKGKSNEMGGVVGGVWDEGKDNGKPGLPGGTYLYLDKNGFPIHLSASPNERDIAVTLFKKTSKERENATAIDRLCEELEPGQILMTNDYHRGPLNAGLHRLVRWMQGEQAHDETFFSIHPVIVKSKRKEGDTWKVTLVELERKGQREIDLRDLAGPGKKVSSLVVCNLPNPSDGTKLVEEAMKLTMTYSGKRALQWTFNQAVKKLPSLRRSEVADASDRGNGVCFDFVRNAAAAAGISEVANAEHALDLFKRLQIVDAVEL